MGSLTKPTRGRLALWTVLAVLWFLLLPQALLMAKSPTDISVPGAVFWAVVLALLVICVWLTWRGYRRVRRAL